MISRSFFIVLRTSLVVLFFVAAGCSPKSADLSGKIAKQTRPAQRPQPPTAPKPEPPPAPEPERHAETLVGKEDAQKVDILWVVDNSSSMETSQQRLADNFDAFIQQFMTQRLDFQMGVTTTDAYKGKFHQSWQTSLLKDAGVRGNSGHSILTATTSSLAENFMKNIMQGGGGDSDERAFQSLRDTLQNPQNSRLLRREAHLAVILISDEDDLSHDEANFIENQTPIYHQNPSIHKVGIYKDFLENLKGDPKKVSVHAIAIRDSNCRSRLGGNSRKIGKRYFDLVAEMSGTIIDLCSEFSDSLKFLSNDIVRRTSSFALSKTPKSQDLMEVKMRNQIVPQSSTEGWTYFPATRSLQFFGSWIPHDNEKIFVSYQLL